MKNVRVYESVVTRLVLFLVMGGLGASFVLGTLALQRGESALRMELAAQINNDFRRTELIFESANHHELREQSTRILSIISADSNLMSARVNLNGKPFASSGSWDDTIAGQAKIIEMTSVGGRQRDIAFDRPTLVQYTFTHHDDRVRVELIIDGQAAYKAMRGNVLKQLTIQWLFTAVLTLFGLMVLRRWVTGPLQEISDLVGGNASASSFYRYSRQFQGEYAQLAQAIGGMLTRIDSTSQRLKQREAAFESLYQFAPAAMVSLDNAGLIMEANQRTAQLLHARDEDALRGKNITSLVHIDDRPTLRSAITRLQVHDTARCELTLRTGAKNVDVVVECASVRDEDGEITSTRLAFHDVTAIKQLQVDRENQTTLLNLLIDHMSDAILLIDASDRVAAFNQRLITLLGQNAASLTGSSYDATTFWQNLGPTDEIQFIHQIKQLEYETDRPAEHRFSTRRGVFLFHNIPVHDANDELVGRLWVVEEITSSEQTQRLLDEQSQLLAAMRHVGHELIGVLGINDVMEKSVNRLSQMLGVEAVGITLRGGGQRRTKQLINLGETYCRLDAARPVVEAVEKDVLPIVLSQSDATCWIELPRKASWAKAMNHAGLTSLAAVALRGPYDMQGMIWIARRGGERLDRHHIYMLEILAPVIAARVEAVWANEWLQTLSWLDVDTGLPTPQHLHVAMWTRQRNMNDTCTLIVADCQTTAESDAVAERIPDIAHNLRGALRKDALLARVSDTRFAVLMENLDEESAAAVASRMEKTIATTMNQSEDECNGQHITIVSWPNDVDDIFDLLPTAERRFAKTEIDDENADLPNLRRAG